MANKQVGSLDGLGFVNKQRTGSNISTGGALVANAQNYATITDLRGALQAANAAYFTNTMLDRMNTNDLVYAARVTLDGGITSAGVI